MAYTPTKTHKWIIAIIGILALLAGAWFLYKSIPKEQGGGAPATTTTTSNPGLLEEAGNFFGGNWIKNLFGPKKYTTTGCDPSRPGYNLDGLYDNNCQ